MQFKIKLPTFEGPFDLLLFFIKRDELDIYDIPISKITKEFLNYTRSLQTINLYTASEFIYMASVLMRIKSKTLLPTDKLVFSEEVEDPQKALVEQLLTYKKYKEVSHVLLELHQQALQREKRKNFEEEKQKLLQQLHINKHLLGLKEINLEQIFKVYRKLLLKSNPPKTDHIIKIKQYKYNIVSQIQYISAQLSVRKIVSFQEMILMQRDRMELIFNFLAILELISQNKIGLQRKEGINNFSIYYK